MNETHWTRDRTPTAPPIGGVDSALKGLVALPHAGITQVGQGSCLVSTMKECKQCHIEKPLTEFYSYTVDGTEYHRGECKSCHGENTAQRRREIREWLEEYKKSLSCEICGFDDHRALQFHHEGSKEANVSDMTGYAKESIREEISKCVVLCANCHEIEHY